MVKRMAIIEDVIAGRYIAPELGGPLRSTIVHIAIEPSLDGQEADLVRAAGLRGRLAIVADETTVEVLGRRVAAAVADSELVVLQRPKADEATARKLADAVRHAEALVAVGSGTLTDLCKYVAHDTDRSCAVFATAPSMNGYATSTASITRGGLKESLPARSPVGIFCDVGVLAEAPEAMILAGLGDVVCRSTAQLDWLLSHHLLDTPYASTPYEMVRADEARLYAKAAGLAEGEPDAVLQLTRMLILTGLGMLVTNSSHSASMGEHSISHYIDAMARPHPGTLHGQQVGIATWTMARLQEQMLRSATPPRLQPVRTDDAALERRYGRLAPRVREALAAKPYDPRATGRLNARLEAGWGEIRKRLGQVMLPMETLEDLIEDTDLPRMALQLDIDQDFYRDAVAHGRELRDRYGFLDLAAQAGLLEAFASGEG